MVTVRGTDDKENYPFCRELQDDITFESNVLVGCYAAYVSSYLPTFRNNLELLLVGTDYQLIRARVYVDYMYARGWGQRKCQRRSCDDLCLLLTKEHMYNSFAVASRFLGTGILFSLQTAHMNRNILQKLI